MKRLLAGAAALVALVATGALTSACDVAPYAASANGTTISVTSLNNQLRALHSTAEGSCFEEIANQGAPLVAEGAGGSGTYSMPFAVNVLNADVDNLLASQFAATKGITLSDSDQASAKSDLEATMDGEIAAAVQQSSTSGVVSNCQLGSGGAMTGAQVLGALPADVRANQIRNQAVDEALLAHGVDISDAAIAAYYAANQSQFTLDCVSLIAASTQAEAEQVVAQLNAGADFATLAKSVSIDEASKANGGQIGCSFTDAQVKQDLSLQSVSEGRPVAPVQDPNTGEWVVYEVTSRQVEPLSAARSLARRELLQSTANESRVNTEVIAFAHRSDVAVNPQYGSWKALAVVAPVPPPAEFLLPTSSG